MSELQPLTAEHAAWYIGARFKNEKGQPIEVYPWWREILGALFDPIKLLIMISTIRQQGKTQLALDYIRYRMLNDHDLYAIAITNAEAQMKRFVSQKITRPLAHEDARIRKAVEVLPAMGEVRVPELNNILKILPANKATSTGTSPDILFFDETRDAPDALWEEIAPSVMGRPGAKIILASTAGLPTGFFYELIKLYEEDPPADWYLYRSRDVINPRTSRAALRKIYSVGSRASELRNLDNEFAAEGDELLGRDAIDAAIKKKLVNRKDNRIMDSQGREVGRYECFAFLDISIKRDLTSLVVVGRPDPDVESLEVLRITCWDPALLGGRISFDPVRAELVYVIKNFAPGRLLIDTASGGGELINWAMREGYCPPIEEFHPTAKTNQEMWGRLRDLLNERKLKIPNHERLIDELRGLKTKEFSQGMGFKVVDPSKRLHRDLSFSLAGASWIASEAWGQEEGEIDNFDDVWKRLTWQQSAVN